MDSDDLIVIRDQRVIGYLTVAGLVILVYDHLLTFDEEIAHVWQPLQHRTWRFASIAWFLFIRYFALTSSTLQLLMTFAEGLSSKVRSLFYESKSAASCSLIDGISGICIIALEFSIGLTLFLRVYAMYNCNKRLLVVLIVVAIATASIAIWAVTDTIATPVSSIEYRGPGCYIPSARAQLGCEILVIVLTIYRAVQQNGFTLDSPSRLWRVMIRDGALIL
ncbi:hypothetical protein C8R45DRAFT_1023624 [Mycena sanguinolenta]|nr:hypothetical protein C8R45DRAFT_1023624 [Mycena sanguinolenta]